MSAESEIRHLALMTPREIAAGEFDAAILAVGATEYHGDHLPYCTDTLMAEAISIRFAESSARRWCCRRSPTGCRLHLLAWPWTLALGPDDPERDVPNRRVAAPNTGSAACWSFPPTTVTRPSRSAARELNVRHGMTVALSRAGRASPPVAGGSVDIDLDHGGQSEMSVVLYLAPDSPTRAARSTCPTSGWITGARLRAVRQRRAARLQRRAGAGDGRRGEAILDAIAAEVGPFLRELAGNGWTNGAWMSGIEPSRKVGRRDPRERYQHLLKPAPKSDR